MATRSQTSHKCVYCKNSGKHTLYACKDCGNDFHHLCAAKEGHDDMNLCGQCTPDDVSQDVESDVTRADNEPAYEQPDDDDEDCDKDDLDLSVLRAGLSTLPKKPGKAQGQANISDAEANVFFKHVEDVLPFSAIEWETVVKRLNNECGQNFTVDSMKKRFNSMRKTKVHLRDCKCPMFFSHQSISHHPLALQL